MGEDQFQNTTIGFILIALFGMLLLTSVVVVGNTYGKDTTEVVGGSLSLNKFNNSINDISSQSKILKEQFDKGSIWSSIAGVVVTGVFGIGKNIVVMIFTPFTIISDILSNVLNIPPFVTYVILAIFLIGLIFGIWSLIKIGN